MGIVFGITGAKEPPFSLLQTSPIEIREYQPFFVAEVTSSNTDPNSSFSILAKYIGVFGDPANVLNTPIAMTAPVLMESASKPKGVKMAMTAPVIMGNTAEQKMGFVLPFELKTLNEVPQPTDNRIKIRQSPAKVVAVEKFSGMNSNNRHEYFFKTLLKKLKDNSIIESTVDDTAECKDSNLEWCIASYHPPFTLPFLRRNEVWITIDKSKLPGT